MAVSAGVVSSVSATQANSYDRMLARMARAMWLPMVAMGAMIIVASFIIGAIYADWVADWFAADKATREGTAAGSNLVDLKMKVETVRAFLPGFKFLGMGLLFSGIIMALANIINTLRSGGAEVQKATGVEVKALKKPLAGWLFHPIMMMGLMLLVATFIVSWWLASQVNTYWDASIASELNAAAAGSETLAKLGRINAVAAWLAPLKFVGVAMLLTSISLALYTIRRIISFKVQRMSEIARGEN